MVLVTGPTAVPLLIAGDVLFDAFKEHPMTTCNQPAHAHDDHEHGARCGHVAIRHDDHVDYLHDGHLHHPHGDWRRHAKLP